MVQNNFNFFLVFFLGTLFFPDEVAFLSYNLFVFGTPLRSIFGIFVCIQVYNPEQP